MPTKTGFARALTVLGCLLPTTVFAQPAAPDVAALITPKVIASVREWLANPIVDLSINAQNDLRGSLSQSEIDALDQQWVKEREQDDKPLISATLSAPLSIYLLRVQAQNLGLFTELFIMDANGLNVGQSSITGDYWQGDEAKFQKTFPVAADAVFIDEPEWDEDLKIWRTQLNMTIASQESGKAIGAATIEINLTELQRRNTPAS
ncbi:hypothetical protein [Roseibium suaedae]|uniref:Uncharacterized protein n=1 Tax=Roseibium suaedae TaxID=735517 RepID=A0A1M6ZX32_9HYPH|nr:hypothetical protein [Roseibium suaedae]SHL34883.1 hypothetical protein SAMN05444272_0363 [Roseibium suaedae]